MRKAWKFCSDREPDIFQNHSFEECHQTASSNQFLHTPPIEGNFGIMFLENLLEGLTQQLGVVYLTADGYGMKDTWNFESPNELMRWLNVRIDNYEGEYPHGAVVIDLSSELLPIKAFRAPRRRIRQPSSSSSSSWSNRLRRKRNDGTIHKRTRTGASYGILSSTEESDDSDEEEEERKMKCCDDLIVKDRKLLGFANTQLNLQVL